MKHARTPARLKDLLQRAARYAGFAMCQEGYVPSAIMAQSLGDEGQGTMDGPIDE